VALASLPRPRHAIRVDQAPRRPPVDPFAPLINSCGDFMNRASRPVHNRRVVHRGGDPMKSSTLLALAAGMAFAVPQAEAHITKIEITTRDVAFGGYSWPGVGQYERIVGVAYGEVNPSDPKNSVIVDIGLAPRNASGNVAYSFD